MIKKILNFSKAAFYSLALLLSSVAIPLLSNNAFAAGKTVWYYSGTNDNSGNGSQIVSKTTTNSGDDSALRGLYTYTYGSGKDTRTMNGVADSGSANNKALVRNLVVAGYKFTGWNVSYTAYSKTTDKGLYAEGTAFTRIDDSHNLDAVAKWASIKVNGNVIANDTAMEIKDGDTKTGSVTMTQPKSLPNSTPDNYKKACKEVTGRFSTTCEYDLIYDNKNITINVSPATGYQVKTFKVDNQDKTLVNNAYTIDTLTENKSITVEFEKIPCDITVTHDENVTVDPDESPITVNYGDDQELTVKPVEGYKITDITRDGTSIKSGLDQDDKITISNVTADTAIVITVERIKNTVTASLAGETAHATLTTTSAEVYYGEDVDFGLATLDNGYYVSKVNIDGVDPAYEVDDQNTFTLEEVKAAHSITFTIAKYNVITTSVDGNGGTITVDSSLVKSGDAANFTVTPNKGYALDYILVDGQLSGYRSNTFSFTNVTTDHSVVAKFKLITFNFTVTPVDHADLDPSGDVLVAYGSDKVVYISAYEGYYISQILVNNEDKTSSLRDGMLIIEDITEDTTVEVSVAAEEYQVLEGEGQIADPEGKVVFRFSGSCRLFRSLFLDGKEVDKNDYTVTCGSTIIAINNSLVNTLKVGEHEVVALYENGNSAKADFTIAPAAPKTGEAIRESSNAAPLTIISTLALADVAAIIAIIVRRKKTA